MEEGGVRIENTVLFGKYQISRMIGQGRSGTVYLAVHLGLEEYRAIKRVPKVSIDYEQFCKEALLLKELRHPGIPIIYDIEEDSEYSYLIEEYLEGDSLYHLVHSQGPLNQEAVIRYGIQICSLVHYLHSAGDIPILYLDLQPKNLLVCHGQIKLIDFDHAAKMTEANAAAKRYGTIGYCAPEQRDPHGMLDVGTDVFAIGSILHFMRKGTYPDLSGVCLFSPEEKRLRAIIHTCLQTHMENRYLSAKEVQQELKEAGVFNNNNISSLMIALIGSKSGVGTTHLSLGLSNYLWIQGYPNLLEEQNRSGAMRQIARHTGAKTDSYGIFQIRNTRIKPWYGVNIKLKKHPYEVVIRDYGTDWEAAACGGDIDVFLLIHGGKWWDIADGQRAVDAWKHRNNLLVVYNQPLSRFQWNAPDGIHNSRCFRVPWFADPFMPGKQAGACMAAILSRIQKNVPSQKNGKGGFQPRGSLKRIVGNICRNMGL